MAIITNPNQDLITHWLRSGQTLRICGLDFKPLAHPRLAQTVWRITKGQACVYFLEQVPHGKVWLLKRFSPGKRPYDEYLQQVNDCLPGGPEFFTCTQRRLLQRDHIDMRHSTYRDPGAVDFLEGTILMPKVPGTTWASIADDLRDHNRTMAWPIRLKTALKLARCIGLLEAGHCCHRDLSSTNLFVTRKAQVFLIDWDCLYHPDLTFQINTTIGTNGYIAPFAFGATREVDPGWSWCEGSDRFALAVLIAEILLIDHQTPGTQEDGTLFSQTQINNQPNHFISEQLGCLQKRSRPVALLLERTLGARDLKECPSPGQWIAALKSAARKPDKTRPHAARKTDVVHCARCQKPFPLTTAKRNRLRNQNKAPLCRTCFAALHDQWEDQTLQINMEHPKVLCEHCGKQSRIARERLDSLRSQGKPILCRDCLKEQLALWKSEQTRASARKRPNLVTHPHTQLAPGNTVTNKDRVEAWPHHPARLSQSFLQQFLERT